MPRRIPSRPRFHPSWHRYAAAQAVLAPLCRLSAATFPARPSVVEALRLLWAQRVGELQQAGWASLHDPRKVRDALDCPHGLLATDAVRGRPCRLRHVCPFCHAERVALAHENVLRAVRRRPELGLLLLRRDAPLLLGEAGRIRTARCALAAGVGGAFGGHCPPEGVLLARVVARPHGVARAVAQLFRYDARLLTDPIDVVVERLERNKGVRSSSATGVFISPRSATHLSAGLDPAVAPAVRAKLPWFVTSEEEPIVACLSGVFDHAAFVARTARERLGDGAAALTWYGRHEITTGGLFRRRWLTLRPLLRAWDRRKAGVAFAQERGYWVLWPGSVFSATEGETAWGVRLWGRYYRIGPLGQWITEETRRPEANRSCR